MTMNIQEVFARYRRVCIAVGEELDRICAFNPSLTENERGVRLKQMEELIERRDHAMRELLALTVPRISSEAHSSPARPGQTVDSLPDHHTNSAATQLA